MKRKGIIWRFLATVRQQLHDPVFRSAVVLLGSLAVTGTVFYHFVEGWTWIDSLYFCVVSLATVGYGDLHPTSELSRLFTIFFLLAGVGLLVAVLAQVADAMIESRAQDIAAQDADLAGKHRRGLLLRNRHPSGDEPAEDAAPEEGDEPSV